ncbi:hypothetical protein D3C71_1376190 [compost metagenome]
MLPLRPPAQAGMPRLQAMPSEVSRSDSSQMAASSRGSSRRSRARRSGGSASQAALLALNTASPQVTGSACTWEVRVCSPSVLPDMVPVMAHSVLPAVRLGTICAKPVSTGMPPSAPTKSAWVDDDTRVRRPARSARPRKGFLQNTTWAGYTYIASASTPCWSRRLFSR